MGAVGLLLIGVVLSVLFWFTPISQALALGTVSYHEDGFVRLALPLTPTRYALLRGALAGSTVVGLGLILALGRTGQLALLRTELRHGRIRLSGWWQRLPLAARLIVIGLMSTLVAVRVWYLVCYPLSTDEVASFDYFVEPGPLAISSFYPIPNNHIFYNWLAWPLSVLGLTPRLVMRLPTMVLGTVGCATGYVLLARLSGLRLATLVTGLMGLLPIWVYYAAVGRGYFIQFGLLQIGFFAVLELLRPNSAYRHLSWMAFMASSVLGLYTIPTYAYPLAGLMLGLGAGLLAQRRWACGRALLLAGGFIGLITLLLYAPVLAISGVKQLLSNHYVATKTAAQFWPSYRAVLYEKSGELLGLPLRVSGPLWLGTAFGGWVLIWRWQPAAVQRLGMLAWLLLALPLLLMAGQRVYAPTRTLLYLTFVGYLVGALALQRLPVRRFIPARWQLLLGLFALLSVGGIRLYRNQPQLTAIRAEARQIEGAYQWLKAQPTTHNQPLKIWLRAPLHELFFAHNAQLEPEIRRMQLHSRPAIMPTIGYDFLVLGRKQPAPANGYRVRYQDKLVTIYQPTANAVVISGPE